MKKKYILIVLIPFLYACAHTVSVVKEHPVDVKTMPDCGECHDNHLKLLNHKSSAFYKKHGAYAGQQRLICNTCHMESFCSDCHNTNDIKPSEKHYNSPERKTPHRGDYLSLHRIEGKINPAYCAKCHGRSNNDRCVTCHR